MKMFKSRFFVYKKHEEPSEGLPQNEGIDQPVSIVQDAAKLAEQSEKAERKALGRLYSNLNEKLQDARQHIINFNLDEAADGTNNARGPHRPVKEIMQVIQDYMNGFMAHASTNEMKLIKKHKPVLQMVLSKPNYLVFSVDFRSGEPKVDYKQQKKSLEADTNKPAPVREEADRPASKLQAEMENRMEAAYNQFKKTDKGFFTAEGKLLLKMIHDYLNDSYNNFTATERASLDGWSFEKEFPDEDQSPTARVYFAANNYNLSFSVIHTW